jgi:hypothetical protein
VTGTYDGLLTDIGGVVTTAIFASFDAYCAREGSASSCDRHGRQLEGRDVPSSIWRNGALTSASESDKPTPVWPTRFEQLEGVDRGMRRRSRSITSKSCAAAAFSSTG